MTRTDKTRIITNESVSIEIWVGRDDCECTLAVDYIFPVGPTARVMHEENIHEVRCVEHVRRRSLPQKGAMLSFGRDRAETAMRVLRDAFSRTPSRVMRP